MPLDIHKLNSLNPAFRIKIKRIVFELENRGWSIRIIWGKRTKQENDKLVQKGFASRRSKHLTGNAVDLIDRFVGYSNNKNHPFYKDMKELAEKEDLQWRDNFIETWDPCHIESRY